MKKKYIKCNVILFTLISLCTPLLSSENSWSLKPVPSHKNWLRTKINASAKKIVNRHTYTHKSFEHIRDIAILHLLPAPIAQGILSQQRENMKKFLLKNEETALEGVRKYLNFDPKEWSELMIQAKKDTEFNLSEMRKDQNFNTHHDPTLPNSYISAVNDACKKYQINSKSLSLGGKTEFGAEAYSYLPSQGILWNSYNPARINFNIELLNKINHPEHYIRRVVFHELTHIIQNQCARETLFLNKKLLSSFSIFNNDEARKEAIEKYKESTARKNLVEAQEKTADTLLSCSDPKIAKINAYFAQNSVFHISDNEYVRFGYPDNFNDMLVLNTNWETSQRIKKSRDMLQTSRNKIRQATNLF